MKSENWIDLHDSKMNGFEFFRLVLIEFSQLEKEMNEWEEEDFHMRMEIFADYTIKQIKYDNLPELTKCFYFIESKIDGINLDIENALNVSYCESLLLGDVAEDMERITKIMPPKLRATYLNYKKYYYNLAENENDDSPFNWGGF